MKAWPSGWIFDLDGTLVDTPLDFDAIREDLGLPPGAPILESIATFPPFTQEILHRRLLDHEKQAANMARPIAGAEDFLKRAEDHGKKMAIFTRNAKEVALLTLERMGWHFPLVVAREDAPPKPSPAGLQLILDHWSLPASEVVYVGDYLYDLEAGYAAGIPTLLFQPDGQRPPYSAKASAVFGSFSQLPDLLLSLR